MEDATVLISRLQKGERELRAVLIEENMGLVRHVAKRFLGRGTEMDDLVQIAVIGLMKAIDQFDLNYQVKFSTYAVPLIVGELKKYFRDNGIIKVSRKLKEESVIIRKAEEEYRNCYGADPTMEDLIQLTNLSREEIVLALESVREVESLYTKVNQTDGSELLLMDQIASAGSHGGYEYKAGEKMDDEKDEILNRIFIKEIMTSLSEKERNIIYLRFFKEMTQTEVARMLSMTQVQVSRMEKKLLISLREKFASDSLD